MSPMHQEGGAPLSVLLLCLAGPLQSWGAASRHMTRGTLPMPTKSGVIGMVAGALGRQRGADISDLATMRFGVRTDQPGRLLADYHTVSGASHAPQDPARQRLPTADGSTLRPENSTKVTRRYYLADAVFLAGLEGRPDSVAAIAEALRWPRFGLYLGRRSCPPARPVLLAVLPGSSLDEALHHTAWQAGPAGRCRQQSTHVELGVTVEDPAGTDSLPDQPLNSPAFSRRFAERPVSHYTIRIPVHDEQADPAPANAAHDPLSLLET